MSALELANIWFRPLFFEVCNWYLRTPSQREVGWGWRKQLAFYPPEHTALGFNFNFKSRKGKLQEQEGAFFLHDFFKVVRICPFVSCWMQILVCHIVPGSLSGGIFCFVSLTWQSRWAQPGLNYASVRPLTDHNKPWERRRVPKWVRAITDDGGGGRVVVWEKVII